MSAAKNTLLTIRRTRRTATCPSTNVRPTCQERPSFNQYVLSKHKSCLGWQIEEAVDIHLSGVVLNSVGVYNWSKLDWKVRDRMDLARLKAVRKRRAALQKKTLFGG